MNQTINNKRIRLITLLLFCLVWIVFVVVSRGATLDWDANQDAITAGYRAYMGTTSRVYTLSNNVGGETWWALPPLVPGRTYYFAVTAYSAEGLQSDFSEELSYREPYRVLLRVPTGKFYVERGVTLASWSAVQTVTGPTNMSFFAVAAVEFFRYRPFFMSAASAKGGAKLLVEKAPVKVKKATAKPFAPRILNTAPLPHPGRR